MGKDQWLESKFDVTLKLYEHNKIDEALQKLRDLLHDAKGELRVKGLNLLAKICVDKNHLDKAITVYNQALNHVAKDNWTEKANIYNKIGVIYQAMKNIDEALKHQLLCLEALEKEGNLPAQSITYRNLGRLYTLKGDHLNSLRSHQKSLEFKRTAGDQQGEAIDLESRAHDLEFEENFEEAEENYQKALDVYQKIGDKEGISRINSVFQRLKAHEKVTADLDQEDMYAFKARDLL